MFYLHYNLCLCCLGCPKYLSKNDTPKRKPPQARTTAKSTETNAVQSGDSLSVNTKKRKTVEPDGDSTDTGSQAKKIHFSTSNDDDEPGFENWDRDISEIPLDSILVAAPDLTRYLFHLTALSYF